MTMMSPPLARVAVLVLLGLQILLADPRVSPDRAEATTGA
jgi:hypothetical protein